MQLPKDLISDISSAGTCVVWSISEIENHFVFYWMLPVTSSVQTPNYVHSWHNIGLLSWSGIPVWGIHLQFSCH